MENKYNVSIKELSELEQLVRKGYQVKIKGGNIYIGRKGKINLNNVDYYHNKQTGLYEEVELI